MWGIMKKIILLCMLGICSSPVFSMKRRRVDDGMGPEDKRRKIEVNDGEKDNFKLPSFKEAFGDVDGYGLPPLQNNIPVNTEQNRQGPVYFDSSFQGYLTGDEDFVTQNEVNRQSSVVGFPSSPDDLFMSGNPFYMNKKQVDFFNSESGNEVPLQSSMVLTNDLDLGDDSLKTIEVPRKKNISSKKKKTVKKTKGKNTSKKKKKKRSWLPSKDRFLEKENEGFVGTLVDRQTSALSSVQLFDFKDRTYNMYKSLAKIILSGGENIVKTLKIKHSELNDVAYCHSKSLLNFNHLELISQLKSLEKLDIHIKTLTENDKNRTRACDIEEMVESLPNLKDLSIGGCLPLGGAIKVFFSRKNAERLAITGNRNIVRSVQKPRRIILRSLQKKLPDSFKVLEFHDCRHVRAESLEEFQYAKGLEKIVCKGSKSFKEKELEESLNDLTKSKRLFPALKIVEFDTGVIKRVNGIWKIFKKLKD